MELFPSLILSKTRVEPTNGIAVVCIGVQYNISGNQSRVPARWRQLR